MAVIIFKFNEDKTKVILFTPGGACGSPDLDLGVLKPFVKPSVKNLGVILENDFKLDKQINLVIKSIFFSSWGNFLRLNPFYLLKILKELYTFLFHPVLTTVMDFM